MTSQGDSSISGIFKFGRFQLSPVGRKLSRDGGELTIGSRAFDMLVALVERQGEVISRRELMASAWAGLSVEESNIRVQMAHLRRELGCGANGARYIASVAGRGYCFVMPVERGDLAEVNAPVAITDTPADPIEPGVLQPDAHVEAVNLASKLLATPGRVLGRDEHLAELRESVEQRRLVTVVGPGGLGKTTLASMLAESVTSFDEIAFVDLSTIQDGSLVVGAVASAIISTPKTNDPLEDVIVHLGARRTLLILDNCEHVIDDAALTIERIIGGTTETHILATSIEALRIRGEAIYILRPLGTPPNTGRLTAKRALAWPSVELFMKRAADSGHNMPLSDDQAATVAAICRRLEGNPLAMELLASRVGMYGLDGVSELIDNQVALRWKGERAATPRHQTVESLLDWTYALLSPTTQTVLQRLSVFVGDFSLESAEVVASSDDVDTAGVAEAIGDLIEKSMISCVPSEGLSSQIRLRETVRTYAAVKLATSGARNLVQRKHAVCYLDRLRRNSLKIEAAELQPSAASEADVGNVRAVLGWAFQPGGDLALGAEVCGYSITVFLLSSRPEECRIWCKRALAALPVELNNTDLHLTLLETLAIASHFGGTDEGDVKAALERGLTLSRQLMNHEKELHLLAGLSLVHIKSGEFRASLEIANQYQALAARMGQSADLEVAGWMLGNVQHLLGDQIRAEKSYRAIFDATSGSKTGKRRYFEKINCVMARICYARVTWLRGFPDQAMRMAENAIDEARDDPTSLCLSILIGVSVFLLCGDFDRAEALTDELMTLTKRGSLARFRDSSYAVRAQLLILRGDAHQGVALLQSKLKSGQPLEFQSVAYSTTRALAEGLAVLGNISEALAAVETILTLSLRGGGTYLVPELLRTRGRILLSSPKPDYAEVQRMYDEGLEIARQTMAVGWELRITLAQIELARARGTNVVNELLGGLAALVDNYSEGFETADLKTANYYLNVTSKSASVG